MPKKASEKKTEFLSVRVTKQAKKELEEIAARDDRSVSWLVARILDETLKRIKEKSRGL